MINDNTVLLLIIIYGLFFLIYSYQIFNIFKKNRCRKYVLTGITTILERTKNSETDLIKIANEIESIYNTLCYIYKSQLKSYPNVTTAFDDIHAVINTKHKSLVLTKENQTIIENNYDYFIKVYDYFKEKYPYYNLEKKQQTILIQLKRDDVGEVLLSELHEDFARVNKEISKNKVNTLISYFIGIVGLIFTILGFLMSVKSA